MELNKRINPVTGEVMYSAIHKSGLKVHIIPKEGYNSSYAIFATNYGSVDSEFIVPGENDAITVPDGIAHFLEHKMFDQPDGSNVFDKFSVYGGNANAFTSFNMTGYLISTTTNIEENLEILMDYVQSPYYTDESVAKEQGIIGQEIRMYDDSAGWKLYFNFINCLYKKHPVKKEIAGTIESIGEITADYLYKCYNTFYKLSNMALVVIGNVDVERINEVIENSIKEISTDSEEIRKIYPVEPDEIECPYIERSMAIATPMFMMGFKDTDNNLSGEALLKKNIEMTILLRMLFAKGSDIYKKLYDMELINTTFTSDYSIQNDYAFSSLEGESKVPKKVYEVIIEEINKLHKDGLSEEDFERVKKVIWGRYIRMHNDIEDYANMLIQSLFMGIDYFDYYNVYKTVTFDDIKKRFEIHFKPEMSALSVINPI